MAVPEIVIKLHREAPSIITVDSCPQTVSSCTGEDVIVNGAFATFAAKNTFDTDDTHSRPQHTASVFSLLRGTATAKQSLELGTRVPRALLSIILCLLLLMSMTATSILLITGILAIVQLIHEGHEYVTEEQMYILLVSYIKLCVSTILVLKLLTVNIEARFIVADKQRIDNKQMIDDKQRIDDIEMTPMKTTNKQRIMDAFGMLSTILTSPEAALIDHDKDLIQGEYLFFSTSSSLTTDSSSLTSSYSLGVGDITGVGMKRLTGGNIEAIANGGAVCLPPEHLQGPIPLKASSDVSQPKEAKRDAHIPHPPATLVIEQHAHGDLIKPFQKENITCPSVNSSLCPDAYLQPVSACSELSCCDNSQALLMT